MQIKNAEILCVGTEILIGDIVNTNAAFISQRLAAMGINQYYQAVVGDNPERLEGCIKASLERCDLLIMTGGLGPTYDDLTKETAARLMGREMILHQPSLDRIKGFFEKRKRPMSAVNEKQAYMPAGAVIFDNDHGTAPGCAIEDAERGKIIIMLPGPPREMKPMFLEKIEAYLSQFTEYVMVSTNINIFGMGESTVESVISDIMRESANPTVAPYCAEGEVRLRITARCKTEEEGRRLCSEMQARLMETEVGAYVYGIDTTLEKTAVALLSENAKTLASAESCTAGLVSKRITEVPGASKVFLGGVVSYVNRVKTSVLGVSEETIDKYTEVSEQAAIEMARGARELIGADIAVSVTGYAGPATPGDDEPVGLVYIGVSTPDKSYAVKNNFSGDREHIRTLAANAAIYQVISVLSGI